MEDVRENLKILIGQGRITINDIAKLTGLTYSGANFLIYLAKDISVTRVRILNEYLTKKGFPLTEKSESNMLSNLTLEFTALTTHVVSILSETTRQKLEDGRLNREEKAQLRKELLPQLDNFEMQVKEELDQIRELLSY